MTSAIFRRWGPGKLAAVALAIALVGPAHGQPAAPRTVAAAPSAPPASPSTAAPSAVPSAAKTPKFDAAAAAEGLTRPETIRSALAAAQSAGPAAKKLAPAIEELLVRGLPPDLAVQAIAALGAIREQSSSAALAPYLSHRVEAVRRAAAEAIANTGGPRAAAALLAGLRSSDGAVRALSARGLRLAGDADSVPDLLRALDRGELDAAPSIAALCPADVCRELLRRLGPVVRADETARPVMDDVLFAMLTRKGKLPDDVLVAAVEMVVASGSPSSRERLRGLKKTPSLPPRVRKAIEAAIREPQERGP